MSPSTQWGSFCDSQSGEVKNQVELKASKMKGIIPDLKGKQQTPITLNDSGVKKDFFFHIIGSSNSQGPNNAFTVQTGSATTKRNRLQ